MTPEDYNNCVKIGDTLIPAVNIQIDDAFRHIDGDWYGIYFEVLWEDGELWSVAQDYPNYEILSEVYRQWAQRREVGYHSYPVFWDNWSDWLNWYKAVNRSKEDCRWMVSSEVSGLVSPSGMPLD